MKFKYTPQMSDLDDCPPMMAKSEGRTAFRYVHADTSHPNNAPPEAIINPARFPPGHPIPCVAFGLSLFVSLDAAKRKYRQLQKWPNFVKRVGSHVATVTIVETDGVLTNCNEQGHITLFEAEAFDLKARIVDTVEIIP